MAISPINSVMFNPVQKQDKAVDKKAAPAAIEPKAQETTANAGEALRSYFLGGNSFSFGFNCGTGSFVTKKMNDVPCCCCGGRMILQSQLGKVSAGFAKLSGEKLADKINNDRDYFRSNQGTIAGMIATEVEKNPKLDARGAVAAIGSDFYGKLQDYCIGVLSKTDEVAKAQLGEENAVSALIEREKEKVSNGKIDRIKFTDKIVNLQQSGQLDDESYDKIINTAMLLPQDADMARKHFNKVMSKNNQGIFNELLKESTQTIEHVHPHSKGGPNDTDNYLAECGECNHPRGNMSYLKWIKVHPEYPVNAQKHIEWFQQQIVNGNIDNRYDTYGSKIKETLSNESNGRMELKVLNKEAIQELRNKAENGQYVNVSEEIEKQEQEKEEKEAA